MNMTALEKAAEDAVVRGASNGLAKVMTALGGNPVAQTATLGTTKPRRARKAAPRKAAPVKRAAASKRKGEKRSAEFLQALTERLRQHIEANPGQSAEEIAKACNTTTKEQALPIRKLIANGHVSAKGQKRATRYFSR